MSVSNKDNCLLLERLVPKDPIYCFCLSITKSGVILGKSNPKESLLAKSKNSLGKFFLMHLDAQIKYLIFSFINYFP